MSSVICLAAPKGATRKIVLHAGNVTQLCRAQKTCFRNRPAVSCLFKEWSWFVFCGHFSKCP